MKGERSMGFLDRILGRRKKAPVRPRYDRFDDYGPEDNYDYEGPEDTEGASLLVDHHMDFIPRRTFVPSRLKLDRKE